MWFRCGGRWRRPITVLPLPVTLSSISSLLCTHLGELGKLLALLELFLRVLEHLQSVKSGFNHIYRIGATSDLCQNVLNTGQFNYCSHRTTGNDTGALSSRLEHDNRAHILGDDLVRNAVALEGNVNHIFASRCCALTYCVRNRVGLTHADSDMAGHIANYHQRVKAEVTAAFDYLGDSGDLNHPFDYG